MVSLCVKHVAYAASVLVLAACVFSILCVMHVAAISNLVFLVFLHLQTRRLLYLLMFRCFAVTVLVFSVSLLRNAHCPPWALLSRQPDSVLVFLLLVLLCFLVSYM